MMIRVRYYQPYANWLLKPVLIRIIMQLPMTVLTCRTIHTIRMPRNRKPKSNWCKRTEAWSNFQRSARSSKPSAGKLPAMNGSSSHGKCLPREISLRFLPPFTSNLKSTCIMTGWFFQSKYTPNWKCTGKTKRLRLMSQPPLLYLLSISHQFYLNGNGS